jgi:hypothetical protein
VQVLHCQEDLRCVELRSFLCELLALAQVREHLPAADEVHHEEDLLLRLEGELQTHQEGVLGWVGQLVHFYSKYLSVFVLVRCSFSIRSYLRILLIA